MSYLIYNDYKKNIQNVNLTQVLGNDLSILYSWQLAAQEKAISYLTQKYDFTREFTNTTIWDFTKSYNAKDRVYFDAESYVVSNNYVVNQLCLQLGKVYICTTDTTGSFDATKWSLLGNQFDLFFVTNPEIDFDINGSYLKGTSVFYKNKVYTALSDTSANHDLNIQYGNYRNVPPINSFPDANGQSQWDNGTTYSVPAGTLPTDATKWTFGDNRSQQMVQMLSDIVIYYIHQRISPQNIPIHRENSFKMAIQWFMDCATGMVTPNLPVIQPNQGNRIRYGGNIQLQNHY